MSDNLYQAPTAAQMTPHDGGAFTQPTLKQKLFSFEGRFSRSAYWGYGYGIPTAISFLCMIPFVIMMLNVAAAEEAGTSPNIPLMVIMGLVALALYVPATWISLAAIAKRFHDRGKSGHMTWIILIPYVGGIWILVECGCLPGTPGPNLYGPDPLSTPR